VDGWAFRIPHFAEIFAQRLGVSQRALEKYLWGDFYFQAKTKTVTGQSLSKTRKRIEH
jgi:ribosome assembly protein 1